VRVTPRFLRPLPGPGARVPHRPRPVRRAPRRAISREDPVSLLYTTVRVIRCAVHETRIVCSGPGQSEWRRQQQPCQVATTPTLGTIPSTTRQAPVTQRLLAALSQRTSVPYSRERWEARRTGLVIRIEIGRRRCRRHPTRVDRVGSTCAGRYHMAMIWSRRDRSNP